MVDGERLAANGTASWRTGMVKTLALVAVSSASIAQAQTSTPAQTPGAPAPAAASGATPQPVDNNTDSTALEQSGSAQTSPVGADRPTTVAPGQATVTDAAGNDVVVTGVRASIQSSIEQKRNQTIISDTLSATDIDGLPATNLGDAIATIPGATTHREKGAASEIAVGGLGPFLSSINVNGRETTTGNGKRSVNFYLFPSELINTVSVNKTQRADLIEGGTSGTIDSRTLRPLDRRKRQIQLTGRGIYTTYNKRLTDQAPLGYRVTGSYVDQFDLGDRGELGIVLGVQRQQSNSPEELLGGGTTWNACRGDIAYAATATCTAITPQTFGTAAVPSTTPYYFATTSRNNIQFTTRDKRQAEIGALQWRGASGLEANFDIQVSDYTFTEQRQIFTLSETTRGMQNLAFGPDHILDSYTGNSYGESTPTYRIQNEKYRGGGFNLIVPITDTLRVIGDVSISRTRRERMDRSVRLRTNPTDINGAVVPGVTTGTAGGRIPYSFANFSDGTQSILFTNGFDATNPANFANAYRLRRDSQIRRHQVDAARLDAHWAPDLGLLKSLDVGGRVSEMRYRSIESDRKEYNFNTATTASAFNGQPGTYNVLLPTLAAANVGCRIPFPQLHYLESDRDNRIGSWASFDPICLFNTLIGTSDPGLNADTRSIGNRNIRERSKAGYAMASFAGDLGALPFSGNLGLRYVSTDVRSRGLRGDFNVVNNGNGTISIVANGQFRELTEDYSYDRWLPSLNLSLDATDRFKVRGAVSRSMTKPDPASLANGRTFALDASQTSFPTVQAAIASITASGNPRTNPLMSWNYDLSLEYYLNRDSSFSLRLFHKDFQGGFVNILQNESYTIGGQTFTVPVNVLQSTNETNHVNGFELAANFRAAFLPGALGGLGFRGSYAFADSDFEQEDLRLGEQVNISTGQTFARLVDPVNIFGLSRHVITAQPYYQTGGFEASLIYKFRSEYYQQFVGDPSQNRTVRDEGTFDVNLRYRLNKNVVLQFQGTNITDTPRYQDMPTPGSFREASYYGATYFVGAAFQF